MFLRFLFSTAYFLSVWVSASFYSENVSSKAESLKFDSYRVKRVFKGPPAKPVFGHSDVYWKLRERVNEAVSEYGVNFAGHFTAVEVSCGTGCLHLVIADSLSGKVFEDMPVNQVLIGPFRTKSGGEMYLTGFNFRRDSRLMIIEGCITESDEKSCRFKRLYLDWMGTRFRTVESSLLPALSIDGPMAFRVDTGYTD